MSVRAARRLFSTHVRTTARQCILVEHPGIDNPVTERCFKIRNVEGWPVSGSNMSDDSISAGHILCDTIALSVDPYMRCRLDPNHPQLGEYIGPIACGSAIAGGAVAQITKTNHPKFSTGDIVVVPFTGYPWQDRNILLNPDDPELNLHQCPENLKEHATLLLGALGMPGMTAWFCMLHAGKPKHSDTVVISAAAGACGSLAGQLAKVCADVERVVGIAGCDEKCKWLVQEMGFDAAVNYKDEQFARKLRLSCPHGVDVYMDNVGGNVSDEVIRLCNENARIPICGQIAEYNRNISYEELVSIEGVSPEIREILISRKCNRHRFLVLDWQMHWEDAMSDLSELFMNGKIKAPETITRGFRPAAAFVNMMNGKNTGKAIVLVQGEGVDSDC